MIKKIVYGICTLAIATLLVFLAAYFGSKDNKVVVNGNYQPQSQSTQQSTSPSNVGADEDEVIKNLKLQ